jgi:hypothetical protein
MAHSRLAALLAHQAPSWAWAGKTVAHLGQRSDQWQSLPRIHTDNSLSNAKPSWLFPLASSSSSHAPHRRSALSAQRTAREDGKWSMPSWAPSPARAPTNGWTCRHQAAYQRCPTHSATRVRLAVALLPAWRPFELRRSMQFLSVQRWLRIYLHSGGSIHSRRWWSRDEHIRGESRNKPWFTTSIRSNITFFYLLQ